MPTQERSETIDRCIAQILVPDRAAMQLAEKRWLEIAKPLHSFGDLEDILVRIAGMQRTPEIRMQRKSLVIFCSDNGVVAENVTQTDDSVTAAVAENFLHGNASASILCRKTGVDLFPVDIGMRHRTNVRDLKVADGTADMAKGPAMSRGQAVRAIETGIHLAEEQKERGAQILAAGEMGIGNTTTASAVASVLLHRDPDEMTGRGAGLDSARLAHKADIIRESISINHPDPSDPIDVMAKTGGFDIAGMAGFYLGAASLGLPVVMDGLISTTAALAAVRICPSVSDYLIASYVSSEPAARGVLQALDKKPVLNCGMFPGEGCGAVMAFPVLDMALAIYDEMATFEENHIEAYVPLT